MYEELAMLGASGMWRSGAGKVLEGCVPHRGGGSGQERGWSMLSLAAAAVWEMDGRGAAGGPDSLSLKGLLGGADPGRWEQKKCHEICGNAVHRTWESQDMWIEGQGQGEGKRQKEMVKRGKEVSGGVWRGDLPLILGKICLSILRIMDHSWVGRDFQGDLL